MIVLKEHAQVLTFQRRRRDGGHGAGSHVALDPDPGGVLDLDLHLDDADLKIKINYFLCLKN